VGGHRHLGTHVSQPLSLHLDDWTVEQQQTMLSIGNTRSNMIYEANHVRTLYWVAVGADP
jgi:stromal membrane-associated protein